MFAYLLLSFIASKLRELKAEKKRQKQEELDAAMREQRQKEREIRLKVGAVGSFPRCVRIFYHVKL